jgi:hypothetical protein
MMFVGAVVAIGFNLPVAVLISVADNRDL